MTDPADEAPHYGMVDEWIFAAWNADCTLGVVSGHRLLGSRAWYWSALVQAGEPLLHLTEFDVAVRRVDPFIVKAPQMWAEHQAIDPMKQWSIGNEAFFVALDDPTDAVGRAYGQPSPVAMDLEWYAQANPTAIASGYEQSGVVHGVIELMHQPNVELTEVPAHRWRRFAHSLGPLECKAPATTESLLRAPFAFPDGTGVEWTLRAGGLVPSSPRWVR